MEGNDINDINDIEDQEIEQPKKTFKTTKKHWQIATVLIGALFIISLLTSGFNLSSGVSGDIVKSTIEELSGANVTSVSRENGLYKAGIKDQEGNLGSVYMSEDGKLLFQGAIIVDDLRDYVNSMKSATGAAVKETKEYPKTENPKVELFYMAYCPYGIQAMLAMKPVVELLKDKIAFEPHYVVYDSSMYSGQEEKYCLNGLCSMHGVSELNEDIRQACIFKEQNAQFWDYVECAMKECTLANIDACWKTCAQKKGVDTAKVEECTAKQGSEIIKAENKLNTEKGVQGSPTIFVNGVEYSGTGRTPEAFKQSICTAFTASPADCEIKLEATAAAAQGSCS